MLPPRPPLFSCRADAVSVPPLPACYQELLSALGMRVAAKDEVRVRTPAQRGAAEEAKRKAAERSGRVYDREAQRGGKGKSSQATVAEVDVREQRVQTAFETWVRRRKARSQ